MDDGIKCLKKGAVEKRWETQVLISVMSSKGVDALK